MILIICGEDVVASRRYYSSLRKDYESRGYEIITMTSFDDESLSRSVAQPSSLFFQKRVMFSEYLSKSIKKNSDLLFHLEAIEKNKIADIINWEEASMWELRFPKLGQIKEFKPSQNIFKLVDSLYPGNKIAFLKSLEEFGSPDNEHFIFSMIVRLARNLLVVKSGETPLRMQAWQAGKLRRQASFWKLLNLVSFYEALGKIEIARKTSSSPFSVKESLAILACHFL